MSKHCSTAQAGIVSALSGPPVSQGRTSPPHHACSHYDRQGEVNPGNVGVGRP